MLYFTYSDQNLFHWKMASNNMPKWIRNFYGGKNRAQAGSILCIFYSFGFIHLAFIFSCNWILIRKQNIKATLQKRLRDNEFGIICAICSAISILLFFVHSFFLHFLPTCPFLYLHVRLLVSQLYLRSILIMQN